MPSLALLSLDRSGLSRVKSVIVVDDFEDLKGLLSMWLPLDVYMMVQPAAPPGV